MSSSAPQKRTYNAKKRQKKAEMSNSRILRMAKKLFKKNGYEKVTIEAIASAAEVAVPTVYAKYKSKRGILFAIIDGSLAEEKSNALVEKIYKAKTATKKLKLAAKLSRQIYEAENKELKWLRSAAIIDPLLAKLEQEMEQRRYDRQAETVRLLAEEGSLQRGLTQKKARDILWAYTGRDFYRLMVVDRGWSAIDYESWLGRVLVDSLLVQ